MNKYYKKYAISLIVGVLFLIFVDVLALKLPQYTGQLVKLFEDRPDDIVNQARMLGIYILIISALMCIGRIIFRLFLFNASTGVGAGLREELFDKAERLDQAYYHTTKVGNVMSWITTDTEEIQEYFGWGTVMLVDGFIMTSIILVTMFIKNWVLSLLIVLPIGLIVVWGLLVEKIMANLWNNRQTVFDKLYDYCEESFSGIRVLKAFLKERKQLAHFSKIAKRNEDIDYKRGVVSVGFDVVICIIIELIVSLLIGFGGYFVFKNLTSEPFVIFGQKMDLHTSDLVEFINYFIIIIWPLIALGSVITMRSRAKASYERIERFLDVEEVVRDVDNAKTLTHVRGKIELKHLSFSYPDAPNKKELDDISFIINPGENVGVIGRVGSGKSTLISLLTRLYNVEDGTLFIDDLDVMKCTIKSVRENIAAVPQENFLFSLPIKENISFGNSDAEFKQIQDAAIFSDVAKDIDGFMKGYDTLTGERGLSLSGGQKQRIAIARAFIKNAPIMIFDDSVSAVDINTEEKILDNIKKQRNGKTTLIISSRVSTVNKLDKIIVLSDGKLEAFDTPSNLMKVSPTYKKMVELQKLEDELKEAK